MTQMKTLTIGNETYEIVDDKARANVGNPDDLETEDKTSAIAAINELAKKCAEGGGDVDETKVGEIVDERLEEAGLKDFATKDDVKLKADDVLYTDDSRAGSDFGAFKTGDSLQNLTLKEIITRLLNVTVKENVIEKIIREEIPMLSGSSGGLEATGFNVIMMTPEQASAAPAASGFYQITADGVVTESGYQLFTESTGRSNYAIALPEGVTITHVYMWDALTQKWLDYSPVFTETGTTTVDGITYVTYESDDSSSGEVLRFEIE